MYVSTDMFRELARRAVAARAARRRGSRRRLQRAHAAGARRGGSRRLLGEWMTCRPTSRSHPACRCRSSASARGRRAARRPRAPSPARSRSATGTSTRRARIATRRRSDAHSPQAALPREDVFVTTKMWPDRAGRERETIEESLDALGLDHVDLWLIHWPPVGQRAARRVGAVSRGTGRRARARGRREQLQRRRSWTSSSGRPAGCRPSTRSNGGRRSTTRDTLDEHRRRGVQLEGYSPLKTTDLRNRRLVEIAEAHGVTPAQVVIRWHLEHEIVVIPKSANADRIAANADVFGFTLDRGRGRRARRARLGRAARLRMENPAEAGFSLAGL